MSCAHSIPLQCNGVTKIVVKLPGKYPFPRGNDVLKTITRDDEIQKVCRLANEHLTKAGWRPEWNGLSRAPLHFFNASFFAESEYKGSFGFDKAFVSTSQEGYHTREITPAEWKELLETLGVTEEEYAAYQKERLEPGPWKLNR